MLCADSVVVAGHRVAHLSRRRKLERLAVAERRHAHARRVESCIWNKSIRKGIFKEFLEISKVMGLIFFQVLLTYHVCTEF